MKSLQPNEIVPAITFLTGQPFPEGDERTLDVGTQIAWKMTRKSGQTTLVDNPITVSQVYETFDQISKASGQGARLKKKKLLETLIGRLTKLESEYLIRIIFGEMRIGAVEGVVLEAIAAATEIPSSLVQRAYMLLGNLGEAGKVCLTQGLQAVQSLRVELFLPIKPMLAATAQDLAEALAEHGGVAAFEYKYDGARIQIHRKSGKIRIFSRRLTDVTSSIPDVIQIIKERVSASEFLIEGEVVAVDRERRPVPFQDLMRRFRRVHEVKSMIADVPLQLFLFDVIYHDGAMQIDKPYDERWKLLERLVPNELLATRKVTDNLEEAKRILESSIQAGHEGLMAKSLTSTYTPGVRGKNWFKVKPASTVDVVIVAADWGSGRRREWLSNYHLAVKDEQSGEYLVVGKTFKGLTDAEFSTITNKLLQIKTRDSGYTVAVKPSIVVEVAFNEIQRSPHYRSKLALRFARITRFREDKSPADVETLAELEQKYEGQFRYKGKADIH